MRPQNAEAKRMFWAKVGYHPASVYPVLLLDRKDWGSKHERKSKKDKRTTYRKSNSINNAKVT